MISYTSLPQSCLFEKGEILFFVQQLVGPSWKTVMFLFRLRAPWNKQVWVTTPFFLTTDDKHMSTADNRDPAQWESSKIIPLPSNWEVLWLRCVADIGKLGWYLVDCKDSLLYVGGGLHADDSLYCLHTAWVNTAELRKINAFWRLCLGRILGSLLFHISRIPICTVLEIFI